MGEKAAMAPRPSTPAWRERARSVALGALLLVSVAGLAVGAGLALAGNEAGRDACWAATTATGFVPATAWVLGALRQGRLGVDVIALLALLGALLTGELFAGAVVTVMLATGRLLEAWASARAERELRVLAERAPSTVRRFEGPDLTIRPVGDVCDGDLLLVGAGEVLAVDGRVEAPDEALLDESALTGEPLPVAHLPGDPVRSGVVNAGSPFRLRATANASDSTYAGIVRLVEAARSTRTPLTRLADRYALAFLPLTLALAGASWLLSGSAVRAVAVLVVATPCPLILAAPVAIVSGVSRTARRGVVVKGGQVLEALAATRVLLFDKTGTLTRGRPTVTTVVGAPGGVDPAVALRLAASLEVASTHVLGTAIVRAARERGLALSPPDHAVETAGHGSRGTVEGHDVAVGRADWLPRAPDPEWLRRVRRRAERETAATVFVAVDGVPSAAVLVSDPLRPDAARTVRTLRRAGFRRIVMVTGDRAETAAAVATLCDVDEALAERTPEGKVEAVRLERRNGPTMMVGDGINDAPALATADVGVAIGTQGRSASSEAADVVLTVDRLDRVGEAVTIARRALALARESAMLGMGASLVAMVAAALGALPPAVGAVVQEAIDAAAIANALRVLLTRSDVPTFAPDEAALSRRFSAQHDELRSGLALLRPAADNLDREPWADSRQELRRTQRFLADVLLPHEIAENDVLYPMLDRVLGGHDPTATMSREHVEIAHLVNRLGRVLDEVGDEEPDREERDELRRLLYGLDAVLGMHFAQEDEGFFSLLDSIETPSSDAAAEH
jgi:heavy metal translocating P-type ATPase